MLYEQFKVRAEAVSAEVHRFATGDMALEYLTGFLRNEGVSDAPHCSAVWADGSFPAGTERELLGAVPGVTFDVTRERAAQARFGISRMEWALADTGSLAQNSTAIDQRLVSSLPTIHIALVPTSGVLPDMPALLSRVNPKEYAYLAMITGPSRTADIERVLTIGVHGPKRLVIIFVDELGGEN
ncbi:MAG: hypothetical protein A2076_01305 [Geobacteraceae bacterium GWC2_53_11]|nr:MAG: hypothetical protein A2076_01305 [Geobacteraceae bacterium GWC2_53_11]